MSNPSTKRWNLVADIGGTNARLGLNDYSGSRLPVVKRYSVAQHKAFPDVLRHFLNDISSTGDWSPFPESACLAVACAVESDAIRLTNSPWTIERQLTSQMLGDVPVTLINDFAAVGYAVTDLNPRDWREIGKGVPVPGRPVVVLGPGTGLGVCSLVPSGAGYIVIEGEGGHVDFAPVDDREQAVLQILAKQFGRVSVERLLSGSGIVNIYRSLAEVDGRRADFDTPLQITDAAIAGEDPLASDSVAMFCAVLGSFAGNLALTLGARGGVYIAGGILPKLVDVAAGSELRERFDAKGRFRTYLENIPVRVVVKEDLGLMGAAKKLSLLSKPHLE